MPSSPVLSPCAPGRSGSPLRDLLSDVGELMWPTRCLGCGLPGELLCPDCRARLPWIDQRYACPVCGAPFGWLTCTECKGDWEMGATVCALPFSGVAARMACALKDSHELRAAGVIAAAMATALDEASSWRACEGGTGRLAPDVVCFVPATPEAYLRRGFDHMELVSRELCRLSGIPLLDALSRCGARDQRKLGRDERARNLSGTVDVVGDVRGLRVLLADDVVTTGASMRECARALLARGASEVTCCALARVW